MLGKIFSRIPTHQNLILAFVYLMIDLHWTNGRKDKLIYIYLIFTYLMHTYYKTFFTKYCKIHNDFWFSQKSAGLKGKNLPCFSCLFRLFYPLHSTSLFFPPPPAFLLSSFLPFLPFSSSLFHLSSVGFEIFYESQWLRARLCCRKISDSIFWLFCFTPRWLVGVMPCPKKVHEKYTKRKR